MDKPPVNEDSGSPSGQTGKRPSAVRSLLEALKSAVRELVGAGRGVFTGPMPPAGRADERRPAPGRPNAGLEPPPPAEASAQPRAMAAGPADARPDRAPIAPADVRANQPGRDAPGRDSQRLQADQPRAAAAARPAGTGAPDRPEVLMKLLETHRSSLHELQRMRQVLEEIQRQLESQTGRGATPGVVGP